MTAMKTLTETLQIIKETEKAIKISSIQVITYDGMKTYAPMWLPKSKIEIKSRFDIKEAGANDGIQVVIPMWLLKDKPFENSYSSDSNSIWVSIFESQYTPEIG